MAARFAPLLLSGAKHLSPPLIYRTSVTISWPYKKGHDFFAYKDISEENLLKLEEFTKMQVSDPKIVEQMRNEYIYSRDNLARIMGVDKDDFTEEDVAASIRYLFPSDLSKEEYRPHLKELDDFVELQAKEGTSEELTAGYFTVGAGIKDAKYLIQRCIFELRNMEADGVDMTLEEDEGWFKLKPFKQMSKDIGENVTEKQYKELATLLFMLNKCPGRGRYRDQISHLIKANLVKLKTDDEKVNKRSMAIFEAKAVVQQYNTTAVVTVTHGSGDFIVNGESYLDYFPDLAHRLHLLAPLRLSQTLGYVDITADVQTSGFVEDVGTQAGRGSGPSDAVVGKTQEAKCTKSALARALAQYVPSSRGILKECCMVFPKLREREYKKAGKKGPRHRYPWRKR